jgi:hypothetical protein
MALPKVDTPTYELTLPSQDITVKFRPFLVKEEKILYMAMESGQSKDMINAIREIVKACTFDALKVDELPMFDLEYIFLQLRAKSAGEIANFKILCPDDGKTYTDVEVDLSKVNVEVDDNHNNRIVIDEKRQLGMVLRYPTISNSSVGTDANKIDVNTIFTILCDSIDHVFEGEKIYPSKDISKDEVKDFLESLPQSAFLKIREFFDTMPKLRHDVEVTNPKTGEKRTVTLEGLTDFFGYASPTTP